MGRPRRPAGGDGVARESITVMPLTDALGAEIAGVDLSRQLDPSMLAAVRKALLDPPMIVLRGQTPTPELHKAFARQFAPFRLIPATRDRRCATSLWR